MKFLLHPDAGSAHLILSGDDFKYIVKVRRHKSGDLISLRSRKETAVEYRYRLERSDAKHAYLNLESQKHAPCEAARRLHIGWCMVDPKTIEKTLPMLCELGVDTITFIHCRRSQHNFRLDVERLERIMESSMMQSGRTSMIRLEESPALSTFLKAHPEAVVLDFGGEPLKASDSVETVVIGCEGGFDENERKLFAEHTIRRFALPMILRSETAAVAVAGILSMITV